MSSPSKLRLMRITAPERRKYMVQGSTQTYAYVVNQNDNSISQYTLCASPLPSTCVALYDTTSANVSTLCASPLPSENHDSA